MGYSNISHVGSVDLGIEFADISAFYQPIQNRHPGGLMALAHAGPDLTTTAPERHRSAGDRHGWRGMQKTSRSDDSEQFFALRVAYLSLAIN
ncbi:hypothetical protein [Halioxenophilus sp. WMMB6]|uniref:hypothetical protein n=1 Tax=Halioxenophilus sp. WMMB6 TaxID=3073815 RepID=UPI00295E6EF1|nr:hypothetical protein [Halioxenophilus sp. WMMB6]